MNAAENLGRNISVKQACEAIGVSRATLYRRRAPETERANRRSNRLALAP